MIPTISEVLRIAHIDIETGTRLYRNCRHASESSEKVVRSSLILM